MTKPENSKKRNILYFEVLRAISAFFVIYNHTGIKGFFAYSIEDNRILRLLYIFLSVPCKTAVPIFFMITGALLLGRDEPIREIYSKRVLRIVVVLSVFSLAFDCFNLWRGIADFNLKSWIIQIYASDGNSYWYLSALLGTYVMLPVLRRLVVGMRQKEYVYIFVVYILYFAVRPLLEGLLIPGYTLNGSFSILMFTGQNVFYVLMGYFFANIVEKKYLNKKNILMGVAASMACIMIVCVLTEKQGLASGVWGESYHNIYITIPTVTLFCLIRYWFENRTYKPSVERLLQKLGGGTFGIYLIEPMVRPLTECVADALIPHIGNILGTLVWVGVVFVISGCITYVLKKIPYVDRFI